jgi:hypothetical protein
VQLQWSQPIVLHSTLMPTVVTISFHFRVSAAMKAAKSCGEAEGPSDVIHLAAGYETPTQYRNAIDRLGLSQVGAARFFGSNERTGQRWAAAGPPPAVPGCCVS